ncbi:spermidine synthase [Novosphingobium sp. SL115]|uniref:spermine/spermidine synthase domain-containing protein n=1 Tax=Novosphingobium sp. SL115 TaxID=2995150 RepID=UPI002273706D|nr:spermidine synthase [Novosphingobium sp. SL115]MCY1671658.1 spermidine synthase [Novosphingobium sp. SL115]
MADDYGLQPGDELVDTAHVPNGARLRLIRNCDDFAILLDDNELMSTDIYSSEVALATMTCKRLGEREAPQLLIGGYGLGFTMRAALDVLGHDASVTVAEIVPEIIDWARGPMKSLTAGGLDDARVQLVQDDVAMLIDCAVGAYDAILLDVDNGPEGLTRRVNDWLYSKSGLEAAMTALRPHGILAVWSATPDAEFVTLLSQAGFEVAVVAVKANDKAIGKDAFEHVIIFAQRGGVVVQQV